MRINKVDGIDTQRRFLLLAPVLAFLRFNPEVKKETPPEEVLNNLNTGLNKILLNFLVDKKLQIISISTGISFKSESGKLAESNPHFTTSVGFATRIATIFGILEIAKEMSVKIPTKFIKDAIHDITPKSMKILREDLFKRIDAGDVYLVPFWKRIAEKVKSTTGVDWTFPNSESTELLQLNVGTASQVRQIVDGILPKLPTEVIELFRSKDADPRFTHILRNFGVTELVSDGGYFPDTDFMTGTSGEKVFVTSLSTWSHDKDGRTTVLTTEIKYKDEELESGLPVYSSYTNTKIQEILLPAIGALINSI